MLSEKTDLFIQLVVRTFVHRPRLPRRPASEQQPAQGPQIELAVDAGYIRALPEKEGVRNLAGVASKLVRPVARHEYTDLSSAAPILTRARGSRPS